MKSKIKLIASLLIVASLAGCAATGTMISKRNLDVQTKMSESIFLDPTAPANKKILVQVRNTSDKPTFTIESEIAALLTQKGWTVVQDPAQAKYMLQANILQVGMQDPTAAQQMFSSGYGGALGIGAVGVLAGASGMNGSANRAINAGIGAGAIEFISSQIVKDVYFSVITDVQISQYTGKPVTMRGNQNLKQGTSGAEYLSYEEETNWKRYRTRVLSSANKANLEWTEAEPELVKGLTVSLSGVF